MSRHPRVGVLGGTFDPIHLGHLAVAEAAAAALALDRVRFVPAADPPHRPDSPRASGYHRLQMVRRAIDAAADSRWEASDLELRRDGPSYSFDTLRAMHAEGLTAPQIFFVTGADAFAEIATWHRYPEVLDLAHFAVVGRPGREVADLRALLPELADRMIDPARLNGASAPRIVLIDAATPDVSSTAVRRRAAAGEPLDGLVPPAVAAYIAHHHLYRASVH